MVYHICEKQLPANGDTASVHLTIVPLVVDAVNDAGAVTRSGGVAVPNVLLNDTINGVAATTSRVSLSQLAAAPGLSLNLSTGAVSVAASTALGTHTLSYRICELVVLGNCDDATVTVTVTPYVIDAVDDYGKGASKSANTVIPSVLTNDRLGGGLVNSSNIILSQIALTPANSKIQLNLTTGAVTVTGKTSSGIYALVYQICERANPTNCDRATATLDLSGGL